ncbi:MAG TPA: hypothetical protein VK730_11005 [Solirubrobacteraceae bacterium]|jgi:hypothetical protein|nr:hypothetical protein [Solirubrobacteraceae bacterium]
MSGSYSYSESESFTIAHARHISSRVAADMRQMSRYYGYPDESHIDNLLEELAQYLVAGFLGTFEIGFKRDGRRLFSLFYEVLADGSLSDSRGGGVPAGIDIAGAKSFNHLRQSEAFFSMSQDKREAFRAKLPVQRVFGEAPVDGNGCWITEDRSYAAGGTGLRRRRFVPA